MATTEEGEKHEPGHAPKVDPNTEMCRACGRPLRRFKKGWRHEPTHGK